LKKEYIDTKKVDYQFVNMAFLGKDSIIGSRAGHAVRQYAPKQYLKFQKLMFKQQPNSEKKWITEQLVDQQINLLEISNGKKEKIKASYKTKDSERSEEHTSELQSRFDLVCRLLLEKKNKKKM